MADSQLLILNVDDDEGARYVKTHILKRAGFEVAEVATGLEALALVSERLPDLVLLDIKLPDINGVEVCRRIKGDPATAAVLVLQTSAALTDRADKIRGLEGGADNYLAAPIEADELIANVKALLRLRRVQGELLESEERFRQLAESIDDVFWILSPEDQGLLYVSPAFEPLWGRSVESVMGNVMGWIDQVHSEDQDRVSQAFNRLLQYQPYTQEFRVVQADGDTRWVHDRGYPIKDSRGNLYRVARITSDITAKKAAEERTLYLSLHDGLTALPNRNMFHQQMEHAITEADRHGTIVAVLLIDLDHFKDVNDSLGHQVGDALLRSVAARLRETVRKTDLVARLGGDEFAVICAGVDRETDAEQLARKLIQELKSPFHISDHEIVVGSSIGVTLYPRDASEAFQLFKNADLAMYRAKASGRNTYQLYTGDLNAEVKRRRRIERGLRPALLKQHFELHYQPQFSLASGKICAVEALLRWNNCPIPGITLEELIAVADETGLITPIGEWVFSQACWQAVQWQQMGLPQLRVALSCSPAQLRHPNVIRGILQTLDKHGLDPSQLELEITEQSLMEQGRGKQRTVSILKQEGLYISARDFGTGFSPLSSLKDFPVDALKIDRQFIRSLPASRQDKAIIQAIIGMAHSLDLHVVAEGIEHQDQLDHLRATGCDRGQGYFLAKPLTSEALTALLLNSPSLHDLPEKSTLD